jgi:hypothetical protein
VREIMNHNPACIEVDKTFHDLTALMHEIMCGGYRLSMQRGRCWAW